MKTHRGNHHRLHKRPPTMSSSSSASASALDPPPSSSPSPSSPTPGVILPLADTDNNRDDSLDSTLPIDEGTAAAAEDIKKTDKDDTENLLTYRDVRSNENAQPAVDIIEAMYQSLSALPGFKNNDDIEHARVFHLQEPWHEGVHFHCEVGTGKCYRVDHETDNLTQKDVYAHWDQVEAADKKEIASILQQGVWEKVRRTGYQSGVMDAIWVRKWKRMPNGTLDWRSSLDFAYAAILILRKMLSHLELQQPHVCHRDC